MFSKMSNVYYRFPVLFFAVSLSFILWSFNAYSEGPCPKGQTRCSNACVNMLTDSMNCGACGNVCPAGLVCKDKVCMNTGAAKGGKIIKSQTEVPNKKIETAKIKKNTTGANSRGISAPFIPGGAVVSDSIDGVATLKDAAGGAAGSNGIGSSGN